MKRVAMIVAGLLVAMLSLQAQPTIKGGKVNVYKPAVLDRDLLHASEVYSVLKKPYGQESGRPGFGYWVVFNDRDKNPVYAAPDGRSKIGELLWGEKLRIADIRDGWALVFYDPKNDYPRVSAAVEVKGWVQMTKLLLWEKGLSDDIGISMKAVICADLDNKGNLKANDKRRLYRSPEATNGDPLQTDMHFYYVLKKEGTRVLLGKNAVINSARDLLGWVEESSFVPWNARTCLEPTWEPDDVSYFAKNEIYWQIYPDRKGMRGHAPNEKPFTLQVRKKWERTPNYEGEYKYRMMSVRQLRYPILDGGDAKTYYCTTFGTLGKSDERANRQNTQVSSIDDIHRKAALMLDQRRVVNIVIAIDGTSSMKAYYNSVKSVLNEVEKFFTDDRVNVGVVIYRNDADGQYVTECFPAAGGFTEPRNQNLRKWLDTGGKYGIKSNERKEYREAVFKGIDTAIDQFFPKSKDMTLQSNILLVIGDCGDNGKSGITRQALVEKLVAQNISLMAFQVTNRDVSDFTSFNEQMAFVMRQSVQKRFDKMSKNPQKIVPTELPDGTGYDMENSTEELNFFQGKLRFNPVKNKPMEVQQLSNSIEMILGKWKKNIDYLSVLGRDFIDNGLDTDMVDDVEGNQLYKDAILAMLNYDQAMFDALAKQNALLAFRGYTFRQADTRDLFKVVVFFPADELKNLVRELDQVYEASKNETGDRRPYYNAMMKLAKTAVAQDQISSTAYYTILAKIFGMVNYTPKHGYTLDDIVDPNVVPYKEYRKIVKEMQRSIEALKGVTQTDYPFLLEYSISNDKYYWLPSEYLPL